MFDLNECYAAVMFGTDCLVLNEYYDPVSGRRDVRFLSFDAFNKRLMNVKTVNPWRKLSQKKFKSVAPLWLQSGYRKTYEDVVFDPSCAVDKNRYYNMFRGFAMRPKEGDWSILRDHIRDNVCQKDGELYKYVISWFARLLQDPGGSRPGTALVFRGAQGCGKGVVVRSVGKIIGHHYRHILHLTHLTGKFNVHLKDALLVFCDEITWGGDKATEGILKGLITEPTVRVEPKNKDSLEVESHINVCIASNNDWVVPAGLEERRFCVLDVSPDRCGDRAFFDSMHHQLENGGYEGMMYDLLHWDYSEVDLRTIPRTSGLFDQIINSLTPVHKFWYQRLCDGLILPNDLHWVSEVPCNSLYTSYLDFCLSIGIRFSLIHNQFSRKLREICPGVITSRPTYDDGNRRYVYEFPTLKECRWDFENAINFKIEWDKT